MVYMTALKDALQECLGSEVRCIIAYPNKKVHSPLDKRQIVFERTKNKNYALVGNPNIWYEEWTLTIFSPDESGEALGAFVESIVELIKEYDTSKAIKTCTIEKCVYDKSWLAMSCSVYLVMCGKESEEKV